MKALEAVPNAAHQAIASLQEKVALMTLVTQNVDDLHERAGSSNVQHLHGTLAHPYCTACREPFSFPRGVPEEPPEGRRLDPPRCAFCGARIRPGVVWFGEALPQREWELAERAAEDCDVFACVGTSSIVYPAASLIERAVARGAVTIQINPGGTNWDTRVSYNFRGPAGVVLPAFVSRM
jgi:NAD-dependent deacetylase